MSAPHHSLEESAPVPSKDRALELINHANQLRDLEPASPSNDVFELYQQAFRLLETENLRDVDEQNILAKAWMSQGIALLGRNTRESLEASLPCFEKAVALRQRLPLDSQPWIRYGLAAGWMNRADALTRLGSAEDIRKALHCHECALHHLEQLPPQQHRLFLQRHLIARLNYSTTLLEDPTPGHLSQALQSLDQALSLGLLNKSSKDNNLEKIQTALLLNKSAALLRLKSPSAKECRETCHQILILCHRYEKQDPEQAEISLKARHLLCQSLALLLESPDTTATRAMEWVHEATDTVEEGLSLGHFWESQQEPRFRSLISGLFRFGGIVYQSYQPRFMADYLSDYLDQAGPDAGERNKGSVLGLLQRELAGIQREAFSNLGTPSFSIVLDRLHQLRSLETRLNELNLANRAEPLHLPA